MRPTEPLRASGGGRHRAVGRWSLAAMSVLGTLGLAELGARALGTRPPALAELQQLRNATNFHRRCEARAQLGERRPGQARVVVIGESSADYLAQQMRPLEREAHVRVANCASAASPLEAFARRFDEAADAAPDAVVLVFGHNLWFELPTTDRALALEWLRLHSRLVARLAGDPHPAAPSDPAYRRARVVRYEAFLRRAAAVARARGFRLVVSTVTPNYWLPPTYAAASAASDLATARFLRAVGDDAGERAELERLARTTDAAPAHFALGEALARAGDRAGARLAFERAVDRSPFSRATAPVNDAIRRVARDERLALRDTLAVMEARASDGIPGWESLVDQCHLSAPLIRAEARATLRLAGHALPDPAPTITPPPLPEVHRAFVEAMAHPMGSIVGRDLDAALAAAYRRLLAEGGAGTRRELDAALAALDASDVPAATRARVRTAAAAALWETGDHAAARALNVRAADGSAGPTAADAWTQRGLFDLADGRRDDAAAAFDRALALDPESPAMDYRILLRAPAPSP